MTVRERFHATLNADPAVDCCPVIEWATWWDKTIEFWEGEGLPRNLSQQGLFRYFGLDRFYQFWLPARLPDLPQPAYHGAPIITNEREYINIRRLILPDDAVERILPQIEEAQNAYVKIDSDCANVACAKTDSDCASVAGAKNDSDGVIVAGAKNDSDGVIVWYTLDGFFWFPRTLLGIEPHLYAFYDKPELYHLICGDLLEWQFKMVDKLSRYVAADFMTIAEDMSYNNGPMISEELFDEFMAPYYKQIIPYIKRKGTKVFVDSDGDVARCIPWFERAGVDGVLPLERQAGVDIGAIQDKHPDFMFIGGFDKMCLLRGKEAIDAEFRRILPILRKGRFIPSIDHQTPPTVTMENYKYYVSQLRRYSVEACRTREGHPSR